MLTQRCRIRGVVPISLTAVLVLASALYGAQATLDRPNDPVIIGGENLGDFDGVAIDDLFLFAFSAANQTWEMIPFQIDERDANGNFVLGDSVDQVAGLDGNDELVFMACDIGDEANVWIDDQDSRNFPRQCIRVTDSLDPSNVTMGWVYLYRSGALTPGFSQDYVIYTPSVDAETGEDSIEGETYRVGGNENGFLGALSFPQNPALDVLDRQKIRGKTSSFLLQTFNEEANFSFVGVEFKDGPVRVLRRLNLLLLQLLEAPLPFVYYKNSFALEGDLTIPEQLPLNITITEIRHSIDLAPEASGMTFSNPFNSNIPIDGMDDTIDDSISVLPKVNYTHVTGSQGTIITLFGLPESIGDDRKLFYSDRTGVNDPGDGHSYGDSGVIITGADIEGDFPLALKFILMGPNQPSSLGELFARQEEVPLITEVTSQEENTVSVRTPELTELPATFELSRNFPNPFNPSTEIRFRLPANGRSGAAKSATRLTIFNLRGQQVRVLVDEELAPGAYVATWNGRDNQGRLAASGVYVYRLTSAGFQTSLKMVFVK